MRRMLLSSVSCLVFAGAALAQAKEPHPTTVTFYITGAKTADDVELINASLKKVPTVKEVKGLTPESGNAAISFDSHAVSFHQVAHAIADAGTAQNKKFEPVVKFQVPEYAQGDNAGKVDEVFKKVEQLVKIETLDKEKGLFAIHFLPLKVDESKQGPQGFNGGRLGHPIHDAPPKGLGLKITWVKENAPTTPK